MFTYLFEYFYDLFTVVGSDSYDLAVIQYETYFTIGQNQINMCQYLAFVCALISFVVIFVLCCLFIYRLIRLVGRFFSGGAL